MHWLSDLIWNDSIAHAILVYSIVIALGIGFGKIKLFGISLGITFVLFMGIAAGHLQLTINHLVLDFAKDFGLILFVYSIGLQVGTGFFSSLRHGGLTLNLLAAGVIFLGALTTIFIHWIGHLAMPVAVGIMSGAVTNTPGLGAAQEALKQIPPSMFHGDIPDIGLGYAVAYPFGVVGIILSMIIIKKLFRIDPKQEIELFNKEHFPEDEMPGRFCLEITNTDLFGKKIGEIVPLLKIEMVFSRIYRQGEIVFPNKETLLQPGDVAVIISQKANHQDICAKIGRERDLDPKTMPGKLMSKQVIVTHLKMAGQTLGSLKIRSNYGVNITRVNRSGIMLNVQCSSDDLPQKTDNPVKDVICLGLQRL